MADTKRFGRLSSGRFEIITEMRIGIAIVWAEIPHNMVDRYKCLGGSYCLHLQCESGSSAMKILESGSSETFVPIYRIT
jgi:hypothetical protein